MVSAERRRYCGTLRTSREGRRSALTRTGTLATVSPFCPAWMIVSSVYV